jgi:hypothetical protein
MVLRSEVHTTTSTDLWTWNGFGIAEAYLCTQCLWCSSCARVMIESGASVLASPAMRGRSQRR